MITTCRNLLCCTAFLVLISSGIAKADLYEAWVMAIDWLVDSADEIHRVRAAQPEHFDKLCAETIEVLKPRPGESKLAADALNEQCVLNGADEGEEWLIFVRRSEGGRAHVFRTINLGRPMRSFRTAAFTREGEPIKGRGEILAAVNAQLGLGRSLPPRSTREAVDIPQWRTRHWTDYGSSYPFGDPAPLEEFLGVNRVRIECYYWDEPGPYDADTVLSLAVVAIRPEDHEPLLEAVRQGNEYQGKYYHPLHSLVNFPGEETEKLLKEIVNHPGGHYSQSARVARDLLTYFHYRLDVTDALNKKLVGLWRLDGRRELIDVDLKADNTFTANAYDFPTPYTRENPRRTFRGFGYWVVRDGRLSIWRSHILTWRDSRKVKNGREIFRDKLIQRVTPSEVVLENGPPMRKRGEAVGEE